MHQQQQSRLFKLPAELRNHIYGLTFATPPDTVKLTEAVQKAPSPTILRSCRAIASEAADIFQTSRQQYWSETVFIISSLSEPDLLPVLATLPLAAFTSIQHLRLTLGPGDLAVELELSIGSGDEWESRVLSLPATPQRNIGARRSEWEIYTDMAQAELSNPREEWRDVDAGFRRREHLWDAVKCFKDYGFLGILCDDSVPRPMAFSVGTMDVFHVEVCK